jgi:hypothetical protein
MQLKNEGYSGYSDMDKTCGHLAKQNKTVTKRYVLYYSAYRVANYNQAPRQRKQNGDFLGLRKGTGSCY